MSTEIIFLSPSGNCFKLVYKTRCADGNGFSVSCTITFLYYQGKVLVRKFKSEFGVHINLSKNWSNPRKNIEYVCTFLREGKSHIEEKIESKEYKIKETCNKCSY